MKKERKNGVIYLTSDKQAKYINSAAALLAMQALQFVIANQNYLCNSSINLLQNFIELRVHLNDRPKPIIPQGYSYTWFEISSFMYYLDTENQSKRIRVITYNFEF